MKKIEKKIQNGRLKKRSFFKITNSQYFFVKRSIFQTFWEPDFGPRFLFFKLETSAFMLCLEPCSLLCSARNPASSYALLKTLLPCLISLILCSARNPASPYALLGTLLPLMLCSELYFYALLGILLLCSVWNFTSMLCSEL